jgi:hypothetical protein
MIRRLLLALLLASGAGLLIALSFVVPAAGPRATARPIEKPVEQKFRHPDPDLDGSPFFKVYDGSEVPARNHAELTGFVDATLRSKIIGKWITSTAPEQNRIATTVTFLKSDQYHASRLLTAAGIPIYDTQGGERILLQNQASGTWKLVGGEINIRVTQATVQDTLGSFVMTVQDAGENRLLLDRAGKTIALFRVE